MALHLSHLARRGRQARRHAERKACGPAGVQSSVCAGRQASLHEESLKSLMWRHSCGVTHVETLMWSHSCGVTHVETLMRSHSCGVTHVESLMWSHVAKSNLKGEHHNKEPGDLAMSHGSGLGLECACAMRHGSGVRVRARVRLSARLCHGSGLGLECASVWNW